MLLTHDVWLTSSALDFLASRQGLTLPATLRPEPIWRDENELAELSDAAHAELRQQNLLDRGARMPPLADPTPSTPSTPRASTTSCRARPSG